MIYRLLGMLESVVVLDRVVGSLQWSIEHVLVREDLAVATVLGERA